MGSRDMGIWFLNFKGTESNLSFVGRPFWLQCGSARRQNPPSFSALCVFIYMFFPCLYMTSDLRSYLQGSVGRIYASSSVQALHCTYCRWCLSLLKSFCNGSAVTWTVVSLTAATFNLLIFPVLCFALSCIANIFILSYGFCLLRL